MGAGAINSMNATIKYNRSQLQSLKDKKKAFKLRLMEQPDSNDSYEFPVSKPWVNRTIRERLQRDNKYAAFRLCGTLALFVIVFVYFLTAIL